MLARALGPVPPVDWEAFDPGPVDDDLRTLVRATFLLEARSEMYGAYLRSVLPASCHADLRTWVADEQHHGRALRRWLARADPGFDADAALVRFASLPYHEDPRSDRGGPARELAARCVVEALASGFYLALADRCHEPLLRQICLRLSHDEHRHHAMFLRLLRESGGLPPHRALAAMVRRVVELEDEQISFAAEVAGSTRRRHFATVYRLYNREHVDHVARLVWEAAGWAPPEPFHRLARITATTGLRGRSKTLGSRGRPFPLTLEPA